MHNTGDGLRYTFHCSAIAWEFRLLLVCGVAGPAMAIKALRGALSQGKPTFDWYPPGAEYPERTGLTRDAMGYRLTKPTKLGYGTWHFLAYSARSEVLLSAQDEALWQHLCKHMTTPLLSEWTPYIREHLASARKFRSPSTFGCSPALLAATDADVDRIVSAGIRSGELKLPATMPFLRQEAV